VQYQEFPVSQSYRQIQNSPFENVRRDRLELILINSTTQYGTVLVTRRIIILRIEGPSVTGVVEQPFKDVPHDQSKIRSRQNKGRTREQGLFGEYISMIICPIDPQHSLC
jgi:hypothetical protein